MDDKQMPSTSEFSRYTDAVYRYSNRNIGIYKRGFAAGESFFSFDYGGYDDCVIIGFKAKAD